MTSNRIICVYEIPYFVTYDNVETTKTLNSI